MSRAGAESPSAETDPPGSWLAERNPSVKLCLLLALSLALLAVFDPVTPVLLYVGLLGLGRWCGGVSVRRLLRAQLPMVVFAASMFAVNVVSRGGTVLWTLGPLEVTDEGLRIGLSLAMRTMAVAVGSVLFVLTTDAVELLASLHQQLHLPARVTYSILAGYRLLQTLPEEWHLVRAAQAMRRNGIRRHPQVREMSRSAFAVLVAALRRGDRFAMALESRGLGMGERTIWRPIRTNWNDVILIACVLTLALVVVLVSAWGGWLRGFAAPGAF